MSLQKKLIACAVNLFKGVGCYGADSMLLGTGKSARGLAEDIFVKLMKDGHWFPGTGRPDVFPLAQVMLDHAFKDILRSAEYKSTVSAESPEGMGLRKRSSGQNPYAAVLTKIQIEAIKRYLGGDEMAKKYLDLLLIDGVETREDFARELGISAQEVTNIQRRLHYKMDLWERLWKHPDQQ